MSYIQVVLMGDAAILTSDGAVSNLNGDIVSNTHEKIVTVNEKLVYAYAGQGDFCDRARDEFENNKSYKTVEDIYDRLCELDKGWPNDNKNILAEFLIAGDSRHSNIRVLQCGYLKFNFCYDLIAKQGELSFKCSEVDIDTYKIFGDWMQLAIDTKGDVITTEDVLKVLKDVSIEVSKHIKGVNDTVYSKILRV